MMNKPDLRFPGVLEGMERKKMENLLRVIGGREVVVIPWIEPMMILFPSFLTTLSESPKAKFESLVI